MSSDFDCDIPEKPEADLGELPSLGNTETPDSFASPEPSKEEPESPSRLDAESLALLEKRIQSYARYVNELHLLEEVDIDILVARVLHRVRYGKTPTWEELAGKFRMNRDQLRKRHERAVIKLQNNDVGWPPPLSTKQLGESPIGGLDGWAVLRQFKLRGIAVVEGITVADFLDRILYLIENSEKIHHRSSPHHGKGLAYVNSAAVNEVRNLLGLSTGLLDEEMKAGWIGRTGTSLDWLDPSLWRLEQYSGLVLVPAPPRDPVPADRSLFFQSTG